MKKLLFTSIILLLTTTMYAGGGWPQPKGGGFFKLGQYSIVADQFFTPSGEIVDITTTGYFSTSIYGEYGITDRLTAIAHVPFFVRSTLNNVENQLGERLQEGDELNSFGDTDIGLKYGIFKKGAYVGAVTLTLGLPLGVSSGGSTGLLQSGDGEFNQMISFDVSRSFGKGNAYATVTAAFNNRTNNFSDEIRYGVEAGFKIKKAWAIMRIQGVESMMNGDENAVASNGIFNNNVEFLAISPEISYDISEKVGFSVGAGFAASGKRLLANPAFNAGVYLKL